MTEQTHQPDPFRLTEPTGHPADPGRRSVPGALVGALAVLGLQVMANGFLGWMLLAELIGDGDHGRSTSGLLWAAAALSLLMAATGAMCIALSVRPRGWVRPTIITIEAIALFSGVVSLLSGAFTAGAGIALAAGVIALLRRDDVRGWYER